MPTGVAGTQAGKDGRASLDQDNNVNKGPRGPPLLWCIRCYLIGEGTTQASRYGQAAPRECGRVYSHQPGVGSPSLQDWLTWGCSCPPACPPAGKGPELPLAGLERGRKPTVKLPGNPWTSGLTHRSRPSEVAVNVHLRAETVQRPPAGQAHRGQRSLWLLRVGGVSVVMASSLVLGAPAPRRK